ncbi:DUF262 domain-containing protein [Chromobacterium amazonense]|uniref:DUF262 domain-containing protein n=1 Tax=Chromobacterium amazonense TaxID=1382803 RepID=UPI003F79CE2F
MQVQSELYSLARIVEEAKVWHFNVPIYQRLYVWGDDQVQTLLNDLINAFEGKTPLFFLGGTVLVEQQSDERGRYFDLIDGQQRFTTLWLLCRAWAKALAPFLTVKTSDGMEAPRLRFAIRPEVNHLLQALASGSHDGTLPEEPGAERIGQAIAQMQSVFARRQQAASEQAVDWEGLSRFVFEQVKFVITTVPRETDLNKLFEVINNRGVQLQHHEILKARMLEKLDDAERGAYAVMWEACADMENYVERALSGVSDLPAYMVCEELHVAGKLHDAGALRQLLARQQGNPCERQSRSLTDILNGISVSNSSAKEEITGVQKSETRVRSIISFPLLLQHALRIWLFEKDSDDLPRVLDRELLALFETHFFRQPSTEMADAHKVRSFIDLLWRLRVLFDTHVIKWVDQGDEEVHQISQVSISSSKGRSYINRSRDTDAHRGFALLQSMLYHSQEITTHYWLTPLLLQLHRHAENGADQHFRYLQHLDNHLLCSAADEPLALRTWSFMKEPWQTRELAHRHELEDEKKGVRFAHYWFYKLEFVLWYQNEKKRSTDEMWRNFRLTAKNSVEHISPQTPSQYDDNRVSKEVLNCFGNLALVSRSINSEYGNLPFNEKRQRFLNKNKNRLDSLKMALIYEHETWSDDKARQHQEEMIDCLSEYIRQCDEQRPGEF